MLGERIFSFHILIYKQFTLGVVGHMHYKSKLQRVIRARYGSLFTVVQGC